MGSTFSGIAAATNALSNSQYGMYISTSNISNADTEGYSVQKVVQSSGTTGLTSSTTTGGIYATTDVEQAQSFYLNAQYWASQSEYSYAETFYETMSSVENSYHATDDTGFNALYSVFVSALEDLAASSQEESARTSMVEAASSFCEALNQTAFGLMDTQSMLNEQVVTAVDQINNLTRQIAELNQTIRVTTAEGGNANALQDQQDLLIDELSSLVDIKVSMLSVSTGGNTYDTIQISLDGVSLVTDNIASKLEAVVDGTLINAEKKYSVVWADTGAWAEIGGGELGAVLNARDGTGGREEQGISYYMSQLNEWVQTFAKAFNEGIMTSDGTEINGHADGYTEGGDTGICFFTNKGMSSNDFYDQSTNMDTLYSKITADNIGVNRKIIEESSLVAGADENLGESNNTNLLELVELIDENEVFGTSTTKEAMNAMVTRLSSNVSSSKNQYEASETSYKLYLTWRSSETSVLSDEEAALLESYESSYNASAKVIQVWSEIIETTIALLGG